MSTKKLGIIAGSVVFALSVVVSPALAACSLTDLSGCDNAGLMALIVQLLGGASTSTTTTGTTISGIPAGFTFTTNLKQGSTGNDVKYLQILLNSDSATSIGNAGKETTYFGAMTKAAVVKFQNKYASTVLAPYGLSAGTGVFGVASRTKANALVASGTTTTTTTGTTTTTTTVPTGTGFTVSLASDSPIAGTLVVGQGIADLAHFSFSNGTASEVKITNLKLRRLGISADATLSKIYLYDGNTRLSDEAVVSSGVISWNNTTGVITIPANTVKTIAVKADIAALVGGVAPTGQTVGVGLLLATDVTSNATAVNGTFPINGNIHTTAAANLATVSFGAATPNINGALDPQENYIMFQSTVTIGTRAANLKSITFRNIGSTAVSDLQNLKLLVDGVQVGTTIVSTDANGYFTFDLTAAPKRLETGARVVKVVGDVVGGSTRDFTISIYRASDVAVVDTEYNVNVLVQNAGATFSPVSAGKQTIAQGNLTITKRTDSPTANIVKEGSQVTLAKYDLKATGEAIKLENLRISFTAVPNTITELRNAALFVDGVQVGSTMTLNSDVHAAPVYTEFSLGSSVIITPGTTRLLEVKADVHDADGADNIVNGSTIKAQVVVGALNAQRTVSGGYFNTLANGNANTLTVANGSLTLAKDQSYGSQTTVVPQAGYLLGRFNLAAGTSEDVNLTTLNVKFTLDAGDVAADITNVYVKYGTTTTSSLATIGTIAAHVSTNSWSISKTLTRGQNMTIEVYGDVAVTAATGTIDTSLEVQGITASSGTQVYANATRAAGGAFIAGQRITASAGGSLTATLDNATPLASQVVAGSTPTEGALKVKLTATNEDLYVKNVVLRINTVGASVAIQSIDLYAAQGSGSFTKVGETKVLNNDATYPGYVSWAMSGTDRIQVLKSGTTYLLAKPTYVSSGQTIVSGQVPTINLADIKADGTAGDLAATPAGNTTIASGLLIGNSTFAADATATTYATLATATQQTLDVNVAPTTDWTGSYALISADGDANFDTGEEIVYVMRGDNASGVQLHIQRGALGTTAAADVGGGAIRFLTGIKGKVQTVLNTKLTLALASDSPSGATTGAAGKVVFTFNASADNNALDPAENKATLTRIDITTTESGATVTNLKLYPSEFDNNATYATTCGALSTTKWRCIMATAGGSNEVVENTTRKYVARGDVGYGAGGGNIQVAIAVLGTSDTALDTNDVLWKDDANTAEDWVNQATGSVQGGAQTTTAVSGTVDVTPPTLTAIVAANGAAAVLNTVDTGDNITVTFSEVMDPTTINANLVPGGTAVLNVASGATGGVTAAANGVVTLTNITTFDLGAFSNVWTSTTNLSLDNTGKILLVTLNTVDNARTVDDHTLAAGALLHDGVVADVSGVHIEIAAAPAPTAGSTF